MKIRLPNGCSCSNIQVHPLTWERGNASIKKDWYIQYRFYDPLFTEKHKYGFQKFIKGMNEYKTLMERQDATRVLIADELEALRRGYNPILGKYVDVDGFLEDTDYIIHPDTGLIKALEKAVELMDIVPGFRKDIESNMRYLKPAAEQLRIADRPVKDIKRRHIIALLDRCGKNKEVWTPATYNRYRRNLGSVFRQLVKIEAMEYNPVDQYLEQKKHAKQKKEILTREEIILINTKLRELNYHFWRFIHIFCNSGARTTEIMQVQVKDVDLERQFVKYTIKKGKNYRIELRPIKNEVLHLWEQLTIEAKGLGPDTYLFSKGLVPGVKPILDSQIRHRWRCWVQQDPDTRTSWKSGRKTVHPRQSGLGIKKSWYSLKYLNTDMMDSLYGSDIAAYLNQHDKKMVENHYAVGRSDRKNEVIKQAPNPLAIVET